MRQVIPLLLVGGIVFVVLWEYLPAVLRFLAPSLVRHECIPDIPDSDGTVSAALRERGFRYLGGRLERIGPYVYQARVYVKGDQCVDVPDPSRLESCYVVTFWSGGQAALTKAKPKHRVVADGYVSVGEAVQNVDELLAAHARTRASVAGTEAPVEVGTLEERVQWARRWWVSFGRKELAVPALVAAVIVVLALVLLGEGVYILFGRGA